MEINDKAPEFTSLDQDGNKIALKDYKGKWVVIYFYPRADTPGCTIEACSFRDSFKRVEKIGAVVLGVSPDTPTAQKKFLDKFDLPFTLVADADKKYMEAKDLDNKFGLGGDPESAYMFERDVREAREKYLLALEAAYRE